MEQYWHGYKMECGELDGHRTILVFPEKSRGYLAVKTEYWDAFPEAIELDLLKEGFHLCWIENRTRWATKDDLDRQTAYVRQVTEKYRLHSRVLPVGMSCGGLIAIQLAAAHPEMISCLYLDAPVLNFLSCPCGFGLSNPLNNGKGVPEMLNALGLESISQLLGYRDMPLDRLPDLVRERIPVAMVAGGADDVVPFPENGAYLQRAYEQAQIPFLLRIKPDCNHHPHGLKDNREILEFLLKYGCPRS